MATHDMFAMCRLPLVVTGLDARGSLLYPRGQTFCSCAMPKQIILRIFRKFGHESFGKNVIVPSCRLSTIEATVKGCRC